MCYIVCVSVIYIVSVVCVVSVMSIHREVRIELETSDPLVPSSSSTSSKTFRQKPKTKFVQKLYFFPATLRRCPVPLPLLLC